MESNKPNFTLLLAGMGVLYYGVDAWAKTSFSFQGQWGPLTSIISGVAMCFVALAYWGDEKPSHRKYHERKETPVPIQSIESEGSFEPILGEMEQDKLLSLIRTGKIIQAIKFYRQATGHGLNEAKAYIDRIVAQERKL